MNRGTGFKTRARGRMSDPLLRSAYSLGANAVVTSALGMLYWIVAARMYPTERVGRDSALVAAMMVLAAISQLNLHNALLRFLPGIRNQSRAVLASYLLSGASSLALAPVFVFVMPLISHRFRFLTHDPRLAVAFIAAVVLWGVFNLQDATLTVVRRAEWIPLENGLFGALKIAALPALLVLAPLHGVFLSWVIPMAILLIPVNLLIFRRFIPAHRRAREPSSFALAGFGRRRIVRFVAQDYLAAAVLQQASTSFLPLVVVALLGNRENAYFYVAFQVIMALELLVIGVTAALVVEGAFADESLDVLVGSLVRRFAGLILGAVVVIILAAPILLAPFGARYGDHGAPVLRLLACAALFRALIQLYSSIWRVEGHGMRILGVHAGFLAVLLGLSPALAVGGVSGIALAWLAASAAVGLPMFVSLWRRLTRKPDLAKAQTAVLEHD